MREKKGGKSMTNFYDEVLALAETYSDRYLEGTKRGFAMMRLLGFSRFEFSISTPEDKEKGGWKKTTIHLKEYISKGINERVLKVADKIAACEFDVTYFSFPDKPHLNFIIMTEVCGKGEILEKRYLGNNKFETIDLSQKNL